MSGAGGGQFGVVTSLTFQLHALQPVSWFELQWSWQHAARVLDGWQRWAPPSAIRCRCASPTPLPKTPPCCAARGPGWGQMRRFPIAWHLCWTLPHPWSDHGDRDLAPGGASLGQNSLRPWNAFSDPV